MMKLLIRLLIGGLFSKICQGLPYDFVDLKDYYKMPPLYNGDDYEKCYGIYEKPTYCIVNTFLKPDNSDISVFIQNFSSLEKIHFRHDKLQRGICINLCKQLIENYGNDSEALFVDKFPVNSKINFDFAEFNNITSYRNRYNKLVNKCINLELLKYKLSGYSSIEYCVEKDVTIPIDSLDVVFLTVFFAIVILVLSSSLYDRHLKNAGCENAKVHYKTQPDTKVKKILTVFSMRRNWNYLIIEPKSEYRELRFLGATRTLILLTVMMAHCFWYFIVIPSNNPGFIENMYSQIASMVIINGFYIVQTFFGISGFLSAVLTLSYMEKSKSDVNYLVVLKSIIGRYFRFAPLLIFFVLFHATWLYRINSGPFWNLVTEAERQVCRDVWWSNLLFVNNYYPTDQETCVLQTWYLAVDFQLSILGTIVLITVLRNPKWKYVIFGSVFLASLLICAYVTYIYNLEPIAILTPEMFRNQFVTMGDNEINYFNIYYSPTHLNLGVYFCGVFLGMYYHDYRKSQHEHKHNMLYRTLFWTGLPIGVIVVIAGYIFYNYSYDKPSILMSFISTLIKHHSGIIFGIMHMGFIYRYGWFLQNIFNHTMFRVLGRISFGAFMVHMALVKILIGGNHYPIDASGINLFSFTMSVFVTSNFFGLFLIICIDLPFSNLLKEIFHVPHNSDDVKKDKNFNNEVEDYSLNTHI